MPYRMGDLAAVDSYDPFAAEQFVNPAVDAMGRGLAQTVMAPGQLMQPNPYQPGGAQASDPYASELASWYDDQRDKGAVDWGRDTAMQMAGPGLAVGAPVKAGEAVLGAGPIRAYHGSPHDFDRFDLSKIGTGEGAQAYGHGLYFAESEGVAKSYRDALAHKNQRPATIPSPFGDIPILEQDLARPGRMYEVNINADPAHFLDWDKPLSHQPPIVQDMARNADLSHLAPGNRTRRQIEMWREGNLPNPESEPSGNVLHSALTDYGMNSGNNAALTDKFREAGIPGIKYLDQGSRGKAFTVQPTYKGQPYGDPVHFDHTHPAERWAQEQRDKGFGAEVQDTGSRNYVVFNDKLIDIMRKYGLAGLAPAGMGALASQDEYERQ